MDGGLTAFWDFILIDRDFESPSHEINTVIEAIEVLCDTEMTLLCVGSDIQVDWRMFSFTLFHGPEHKYV